jgi:TetR/AcrR family fatty acid metabolism transcriptional regulator
VRCKTAEQADKVLDAAAQLFGLRRFHEVRMEDIAAQAEVGKGTLYRYFADKEELYLGLLDRASRQYLALIDADVAKAEGPGKKLRALVAAGYAFFDGQPHLGPLIQRAEVTHENSPWQPARDAFLAHIRRILAEAREDGAFSVADPEMAALLLLGGLRSVYMFGRKARPRELADRIVTAWLHGVAEPALAATE